MRSEQNVTGCIFDIERFAIHDGPGIRTLVFLKGCTLDCQWCANPESKDPHSQLGYKQELCIHCNRCVASCPENNLLRQPDSTVSVIDSAACGSCNICVDTCPQEALVRFGTLKTVSEVMDTILKDEPFYKESGGGVTFSGGEALMQDDFLYQILRTCKARGIHTAIETAGFVSQKVFERLTPFVDLYLYDIKQLDSKAHQRYIGYPNELILSNLKYITTQGTPLIARIPLIQGYNDSENYLVSLFEFLMSCTSMRSVHFLPYHELGRTKHQWLREKYFSVFEPYDNDRFDEVKKRINTINTSYGFEIVMGGLE